MNLLRVCLLLVAASAALPGSTPAQRLEPYTDTIPGTLVAFSMVPIPGGAVSYATPSGTLTVQVDSFWIGSTEVTWDMYDIFAFRLDLPREARPGVDASARPSRPYGAPDRGFGHAGYPAISMTHHAAVAFAAWLSEKTGRNYRLATEAQWMRAANLFVGGQVDLDTRRRRSWSADDAGGSTHPVGTRQAGAIPLHDMLGNAAEWVTADDGTAAVRGGSFLDSLASLTPDLRVLQERSWNETDPQIPRSRWWLSDAVFTGFRIVRIP